MSNPFRVAVVAEGPTDKIVIEAVVFRIFGDRPFILRHLQPEESQAFTPLGTGWGGVYRWCRQASERAGGPMRYDMLFQTYDLLILHLDAEVAAENYGNAGITDPTNDLPCACPCPPPEDTTNALRNVMLRWIGEAEVLPKTVFCTPAMMTETWVLCALYPDVAAAIPGIIECYANPHNRLQAQPKAGRLRKTASAYRGRSVEITNSWHRVRAVCSEAERFSTALAAFV